MNIKISILMVNYHTEDYILEFLQDLITQTLPFDAYEIIIANNCQTELLQKKIQQADWLKKLNIQIIKSAKNLGFGRAMNLVASHANGEHFLIANPDLRMMQNDYLEKLVEKTKIHSDYGIITTKLINDLHEDKSEFYNYEFNQSMGFDLDEIKWFSGALLLLKNKIFKQLNGFDQDFFMYCEDEDLCLRAKKNKLSLIKINDLQIYHEGGASEAQRDFNFYCRWYKSILLFLFKHLPKDDFEQCVKNMRQKAQKKVFIYKCLRFLPRSRIKYKFGQWRAILHVCDKTLKESTDWLYFHVVQ